MVRWPVAREAAGVYGSRARRRDCPSVFLGGPPNVRTIAERIRPGARKLTTCLQWRTATIGDQAAPGQFLLRGARGDLPGSWCAGGETAADRMHTGVARH
jgi:hypothetical protein